MKYDNLMRKLFRWSLDILATVLICGALFVLIWLGRPYVAVLLKSGQVNELEKKAAFSRMDDNRIIIPSVVVDAPIREALNAKQLSQSVVHVRVSAYPWTRGNCILEGHNLAEFGLWQPQSFFSLLDIIKPGTKVYLFWNGKKYPYEVSNRDIRDVNDPSLYKDSKNKKLTLITCVSTWSTTIYTTKRAVVTCKPLF